MGTHSKGDNEMSKISVYEIVTNRVLEAMDKGTVPWRKPWKGNSSFPFNAATGRRYSGGNLFFLSMLPYSTLGFVTFNQIKAAKATIKAGEEKKHTPVFYWRMLEKTNDKGKIEKIPMLRYFLVWNVEQLDGFVSKHIQASESTEYEHDPIESAEAIVQGYANAPEMIIKESNVACYRPADDTITVPQIGQYENPNDYYSTLFHEMGHSTGHASRLNRKEVTDPIVFGSHSYSIEEMVAELTAAFLCAESGIDNTIENSAAYIKGWHTKLQADPKLFWTAASKAQKAANHILGKTSNES